MTRKRNENCRRAKYPKERYDNFEMPSDDMDVDIQNFSSKLSSVRKETTCVYCGAKIRMGDYALAERGFLDEQPFYAHNCLDCVEEVMDMQDGKLDADDMVDKWSERARRSGFIK